MTRRLRGILCTILLALAVVADSAERAGAIEPSSPIVILISIDGSRWDYIERFGPPVIGKLAAAGVRSEGLIPIFPSKTFPNHYTVVTGLHAARHGITSNTMVDPHLPGRFTLADREVQQDTRWWGGEPLWVGAERQGRIAATMFWPGSDAEIAGDRPTYWRTYEHEFPNAARVDQLLAWLKEPEARRPTFLTLYFSDVDDAGHRFGPNSHETRIALLGIDAVVGRLVAGVERLGLASRTNYVIVSDHGMTELSRERVIVLDDYLDLSSVDLIDSAPIVGINTGAGVPVESVYGALASKHPAMQMYTRGTLPEAHRLRDHPRLPDVIGIVDDGWHPTTRGRLARDETEGTFPGGNHGYEPRHRSMHGLFVATGPQFKRGVVVPPFENIHVYELLCRAIGVRPASNDGDPAVTASFLR
ncbi:MAG TPA: ectonucleotide pyrophosphatase/phosphodiesterase [Vicinamibacterales bacterium]|nr:ectonucleotide pyrophosphatase/phosphodiesterase [Vicinamibacterales bacterium]